MFKSKWYQCNYRYLAGVIILCAFALRLYLIVHNWPVTDSEEGTMGLEALHIALRGEHPIYFYGQNYMGVGEAYLGALFFHIFGVSIFSLRLGMLLLFTLFLLLIYCLSNLLYGGKVACIVLLLLVGGTENVLTPEMKAVGGAVETLVFGTLVLLLASKLSFWKIEEGSETKHLLFQRRLAYSGWGIAVGLGLWSHLLVAPFIFCSMLLLFLFCRDDLRTKSGLFVCLGLAVGALSLIIYNITAPIQRNTLAVFLGLHNTIYPNAPTGLLLWLKQLSGTFLYTLPIATGLPQVISNTNLPLYSPLQLRFLPTILLYGLWSLGYILLLFYAILYSLKPVYLLWRKHKTLKTLYPEDTHKLILCTSRSLLLVSAWFTLLSYMTSSTAAQRPWSFRYLVGLMIVLPALIGPLVNGGLWTHNTKQKAKNLFKVSLVLIILIVSFAGTVQSTSTIPSGNRLMRQQEAFVKALLAKGITRIYSGYWVCDRLIFASKEQVICAVLEENMEPGLTRYISYRNVVDKSRGAAYVFTTNTDFHPSAAIKKLESNAEYRELLMGNYIVFVPLK